MTLPEIISVAFFGNFSGGILVLNRRRLAILLVGTFACVAGTAASALEVRPQLGWDSAVRLGRWNVAAVEVQLDAAGECWLECQAIDSEGHTAKFQGIPRALSQEQGLVTVPFQVGRPDAQIQLQLYVNGEVVWSRSYRPKSAEGWTPLVLSDRLVVTAGQPKGFGKQATNVGIPGKSGLQLIELATTVQLPDQLSQYLAIDWLVLAGPAPPNEMALDAIGEWVRGGGRLLVSFPAAPADWRDSPLRRWLPLEIADEPVIARELGTIEAFASRNLRIPFAGRLEIPQIKSADGIALASSREDPLLYRVPWGFGEVLVLTLDLTKSPLATWGGVDDLVQKCLAVDQRKPPVSQTTSDHNIGPLTSSGISDFASQLQAVQDHFPNVRRPAPWWSMAWLLGLLALVGPVDYLIVHRLLRRPRWTWLTLPLCLLGLVVYAGSTGEAWNQGAMQLNQIDVVDVDTTISRSRVKSWTTIYSPATTRLDCQWSPTGDGWSAMWAGIEPSTKLSGWFAIPESSTGGLYRPGGGEWGRTSYRVAPETGELHDLPVLQWSSRTLTQQWSGAANQVAESNLRNTGLGRLTGDFRHHLPGTLTDWMLAYGGRVYRLQTSRSDDRGVPLEADTTLSTENPLFLQGDLRSYLTRVVITRNLDERRVSESRILLEQGRYDVAARDPWSLWQMISFQRQAGGVSYTGLTNDWLFDDDFTRQIELGRAVLFGRLEAPAAGQYTVNGESKTPDRSQVFVRIVFPVRRSGDVVRQLPKFDKDD